MISSVRHLLLTSVKHGGSSSRRHEWRRDVSRLARCTRYRADAETGWMALVEACLGAWTLVWLEARAGELSRDSPWKS
jgi:hypothetical protein